MMLTMTMTLTMMEMEMEMEMLIVAGMGMGMVGRTRMGRIYEDEEKKEAVQSKEA